MSTVGNICWIFVRLVCNMSQSVFSRSPGRWTSGDRHAISWVWVLHRKPTIFLYFLYFLQAAGRRRGLTKQTKKMSHVQLARFTKELILLVEKGGIKRTALSLRIAFKRKTAKASLAYLLTIPARIPS